MHMVLKLVVRLRLNQTVYRKQCVFVERNSSLLGDENTSSWWQHGLSVIIGKRNSCSIPTGTEGCIIALTGKRTEFV